MSFKSTAAHSSRIKNFSEPPTLKHNFSSSLPFSLPGRKPIQRSPSTKPDSNDDEDLFSDRLDYIGLVKALATDLTLRDVAQAIKYIRGRCGVPSLRGLEIAVIVLVSDFELRCKAIGCTRLGANLGILVYST
jgi:hypothetical protein